MNLSISKPTINLISRMSPSILIRQEPVSSFTYIYSESPVEADWHVVIDITEEMFLPNVKNRCLFVVAEPPEIRQYDTYALAEYGLVLSAPFKYLKKMENLKVETGLLPWRIGIGIERESPSINLSCDEIARLNPAKIDSLTVVTSNKAYTKQQIHRLRLIDFLSSRIPEMQVFGRDTVPVDDKADALVTSRYHLALENCTQDKFWTEKLSDPILTENITFYSGHNLWRCDFPGWGAIHEVDVSKPRNAYAAIRRVLDSGQYERVIPILKKNKNRVLHDLNLHKAIERAIIAQSPRDTELEGRTTYVPTHRSRRDRLKPTLWLR